jgi:uncharacterized protein YjbI with pentapeptide repeats
MSNTVSSVPARSPENERLPSAPTLADPTFTGQTFTGQTFTDQTFTHIPEGAVYMNCVFKDTRWLGLRLQHVRFINCHFDNMFCSDMGATAVHWEGCEMRHWLWQGVDIAQSRLIDCVVADWRVDASKLVHVGLTHTQVSHWHLADCRLAHLTWMGCSMQCYAQVACHSSDVSWVDSTLADARVERCQLERFIAAQTKASAWHLVACTGSQVRATQSEFSHAIFKDNDLEGASWSHSALNDCQFVDCNLPLAGFDHAVLTRVCFEGVAMPRALFDQATVQASQFQHVQAPNASLRSVQLSDVAFKQTNLSALDALGLQAEFLQLQAVDCRGANLIGQTPQIWSGAQLQGARFEEAKAFDDRAWWRETRPGPRMELP